MTENFYIQSTLLQIYSFCFHVVSFNIENDHYVNAKLLLSVYCHCARDISVARHQRAAAAAAATAGAVGVAANLLIAPEHAPPRLLTTPLTFRYNNMTEVFNC